MDILDESYWSLRYKTLKTGWDIGRVSPPIASYVDQLGDKRLRILIPGAGNAYEAEYLWKRGFKNLFIMDIARQPLDNFKFRVADFPESNLINADFFEHEGIYDLIIEQTFFSAIPPAKRKAYSSKMNELLVEGGKLMGLFWARPMNIDSPPFGGDEMEYRKLFLPYFSIRIAETCYNSIQERKGAELFVLCQKGVSQ